MVASAQLDKSIGGMYGGVSCPAGQTASLNLYSPFMLSFAILSNHVIFYYSAAENKILIQCGEDIKAENGKLSYKGKEGRNYLCIWRISVEYGKAIAFNLTKLSISYPENWLRLLDGSDCGAPVVHFVNGDSENRLVSLTSTSNTMMVIYAAINGDETDTIEADYNMVSAPPGTTSTVSAPSGTTSEAGSKLIPMAATNLLLIIAARSYALS
ncbi:unnamed protein product [Dicrocoelium dendriticum]|nr:unnamed protein product [Dicrocoelium dendriticum]